MKRALSMILALVCLFTLTGCAGTSAAPSGAVATLPPAVSRYDAPTGDAAAAIQRVFPLYLPSRDGQKLLAQYSPVSITPGMTPAEAVVRALLAFPGNDAVTSLGGSVTLGLYGTSPVEASGSVCTVNLSSSALQLDYDQRYTLFLALASTLCEVDSIRFVNVLVADQAVGLDISGNLAAGSLTAHPGEELPVLWEQMDARRTPLGADAAQQPLSATATLYFPLADGAGFLPETRNLTFAGQTAAQYVTGLLAALSAGAQYTEGVAAMPDLSALLTDAPAVTELNDGGRMVTLHFTGDLDARLDAMQLDHTAFVGALVYTITSFVPAVGAVRVFAGSTLMTALYGSPALGSLAFPDGVQRRRQYTAALMEPVTIYLNRGERLVPVQRVLPAGTADDPRSLIALLMAGPTEAERRLGVTAVLPVGMDRTDVLAAAADGDTLLLNLSPRFERLIRQGGAEGEQLLCYSIVTTLCRALGLRRVQFFWNGQMLETLGGSLYWGGDFLLNNSLLDQTIG